MVDFVESFFPVQEDQEDCSCGTFAVFYYSADDVDGLCGAVALPEPILRFGEIWVDAFGDTLVEDTVE